MKKIVIKIMFIITLCIFLTGCGVENKSGKNTENINSENHEYSDVDEEEIKDPVIDWWKLYKNLNKKNCVTVQVSNPNNFPIGFSYDLVYYKGNEVVRTESKWAMTGIDSKKTGIIYGDIDIPSADSVDKIVLENVEATKFEWKPISGTFKKTFIDKGVQYFDAEFPESPSHTEIWVVLYNDSNGDKKVQSNEFVQMGLLAPFVNILETKGEIQIPVSDERLTYTDYEIYSFAFTR